MLMGKLNANVAESPMIVRLRTLWVSKESGDKDSNMVMESTPTIVECVSKENGRRTNSDSSVKER